MSEASPPLCASGFAYCCNQSSDSQTVKMVTIQRQTLRNKVHTSSVSGTWLNGGLDWPSDIYFDDPSTEFVEVHVVDRVLGICRRRIRDESKSAMFGL